MVWLIWKIMCICLLYTATKSVKKGVYEQKYTKKSHIFMFDLHQNKVILNNNVQQVSGSVITTLSF